MSCPAHGVRPPSSLLALLAAAPLLAVETEPVSLATLLPDLIDLGRLAEFPSPAYTCRQFSSYDRASTTPDDPKTWFANNDCGQYLRLEERDGRKEQVMMDAQGPGAIVRIWSANPDGILRIYIDGSTQPTLETPLKELLGGRFPGLPRPLAGDYSKGWSLYLPIPYATSCKATVDAKGGLYYHINYRTYPAGTPVLPFAPAQLQDQAAALRALAARLEEPARQNAPPADATEVPFAVSLPAGGTATLARFSGMQALRRLRLRWPAGADREEPALRSTLLTMSFDGEETVVAPLGDFFGAAPGINPYEALPLGVAADGTMACRWVMPFQRDATVSLRNGGTATVALAGSVVAAPYAWTDASLHFHGKWRIEHDVSTEPKQDWNYLTATGKGVFAGVAFAIDNPVKAWWGEGDEKIYVDGERFPSHFGTGSEDYYGYAWCSPQLFTHAYHAQPRCDGPGNFGRTSVNRFHIIDRIPFTTGLRFDMELWHWKRCLVNLSVMDYWYARPGGGDAFKPLTAADTTLRPPPVYVPTTVSGAIEGEAMSVLEKTGEVAIQAWDGDSNDHHLWWRGGQRPGDRLVLGFPAPAAGTYRILGRFLKAVDYGIASFAINDQAAGAPIDFYHDKVVLTKELALGTARLASGQNRLSIAITGRNPLAKESYMIGLDYIRLEAAP